MSLAPGENTTVEFTSASETVTQPGQQLLVSTADDQRQLSFTGPQFEIQETTTEIDGDEVTTTATIENVGDANGQQTVAFRSKSALAPYTDDQRVLQTPGLEDAITDWLAEGIETGLLQDGIDAWLSEEPLDPLIVKSQNVSLEAGETTTVEFSYDRATADQPGQRLSVATADDEATVTLPETATRLRDRTRRVGLGLVAT